MVRNTMLAVLLSTVLGTGSALAQATALPSYQSPYRAFVRSEVGGVVSFPEPNGTGYEGMYRFGSGAVDVGVRGGVWDPIGLAPSSLLIGVEARDRVITHTEDFPLDGALVFGVGGSFRSGSSQFLIPGGLSLGRRIDLKDSPVSLSPFVQPTAFLRGGTALDTDVLFGMGIGMDARLSRAFDVRMSVGVGDVEGISVGAVWIR